MQGRKLSIFCSIIIGITAAYAGDTGQAFPLRIDWLRRRFAAPGLQQKTGLSLVSPNYVQLNSHILPVKFGGMLVEKRTDPSGRYFLFNTRVRDVDIMYPSGLSIEQYIRMKAANDLRSNFIQTIAAKQAAPKPAAEKIELLGADIAGQRVSLQVSGNVNINGRLQNQQRSQVRSGYREGQTTSFVIDQKQQLMIEGKIGDRISILVDQDSERDFDWENNMRIIYTGKEDDIVQKVEAGNVALNLPSTQFVTFSGKNNGLFGLKSLMKFGGLNVTAIASVEKGKKEKLSVEGGAQSTTTTIKDYEYRRNLYFYLDTVFRATMYSNFKRTQRLAFNPNRTVVKLEVYKSQVYETAGCLRGKAYIDPNRPALYPERMEQRIFKRLELGKDYTADLNLGFIRLNTQVQDNEVIGVAYQLANGEAYGDYNRADNDTSIITLKLIKPQYMSPDHPCWDLEFKNVYSLGATGISEDGFSLKIVYTHGSYEDNDRDPDDGKTYIYKFGLDIQDKNGNPTPDDLVDTQNKAIINLGLGEIWFPYLRPFQYGPNDESGERNPNLAPKYNCSAMYDSSRSNYTAINEDTKFKIIVNSKSRSSTINLGAMVIENSEIVTLNGSQLQRGVDYTIDYFSGILTLLKQGATDPDAQLDVKYEKNQFFQLDKKTILGARAEYPLGENSFIGATALYFSQSVIDEKVDVGYEPMRNFVWDINGKFNRNLDFMTRAINWLPLIETDAKSTLDFEGEIAQVRPNPNTISNEETGDPDGVGFLDDFEGSKRITSPPIMRRYWSLAAPPKNKNVRSRGFTFWYNPFSGVATTSIWPNKQVSARAQNNITEVLVLAVDPQWAIDVGDGVKTPQEAWGGITYYFPTSYYDQSTTKYFEIWVWGKKGRMHIDLGQISEDQNGDGVLNTEDKPEAGFAMGNDLLDKNEDTGLDGRFDTEESITTNRYGVLSYGDSRLTEYRRDPEDPASDNWKWSEGSTNYRHINGTEGNSKDVNGLFPDTEDLNSNYVLDPVEDYYTAEFDLNDEIDTRYLAGKTIGQNGRPTGWKLYRIPLVDFTKDQTGKDINWQNIRACRIWMDGMADEDSVWIAKIELVGNEWKELGIAPNDTSKFVRDDANFAVSVINTEDNPDVYEPPKGVEGEYDRINEIRSKEQSIVLWFDGPSGLKAGELCGVKKPYTEEVSFINYKRMKLFVYGRDLRYGGTSILTSDSTSPVQFFIRFGKLEESATQQYYEYRQPIFPQWDKRNRIDIDLDFITYLKSFTSEADFPDNDGPLKQLFITYKNGQVVKRHYREVKKGRYTGKEIIIVNNPSIARISRIDMGIKNRSDDPLANLADGMRYQPVFGEVWLDELRLSSVRRDNGVAYRTRLSLKMADLATLDLNLSQTDADFHTVEQRPSAKPDGLNTSRNLQLNSSLALHKFLPANWGISLPVRGSFNESVIQSKYIPGSDILMPANPIDTLLDVRRSYSVGTSFEKRAGDHWLTKYTIDQLKLNVSAQWSEQRNKDYRLIKGEKYSGDVKYGIPFGTNNYLEPFKWAEKIPILDEKLAKTRWYYTPTNLDFSVTLSEEKNSSERRWGESPAPTHTLGMDRGINLSYKLFDNLSTTASYSSRHNLNDYVTARQKIFKQVNPGKIIDVRESYSFNYSPKIFSWFNPNLTYTSNYNWNEPYPSNTKSVDRISNQNRFSTSFSLDPAAIFNSFFKTAKPTAQAAPQPTTPTPAGRRRTTEPAPAQTQPAPEAKSGTQEKSFRTMTANFLKKIQAFQINYSINRTVQNLGRVGTPDWLYHLGWQTDPGLPIVTEEVGINRDNTSRNVEFSVRTSVNVIQGINVPLNFAQTIAVTNSQGQTTKNLTRDFLPLGNSGKDGFPFPGWSVNWSGLEKNKFVGKFLKRLSFDHAFQGKETVVWQNGVEKNSSYTMGFQPLLGANMQFKNDVSGTLRYTQTRRINNISGATSIVDEKTINGNLSYQKAGGLTIPLPFLADKRLDNNINFNLNFDYTTSRTRDRASQTAKKFTIRREDRSWNIEPRANYTFTKKVTGGLFFKYGEAYNRQTGKRITRNYGFDVNIAIRG